MRETYCEGNHFLIIREKEFIQDVFYILKPLQGIT